MAFRQKATVIAGKKGIGIYGLKGFTYKVYKDRHDVQGIGYAVVEV